MDKFYEAQERFKLGSLFDGHAYARDLLVNYGNGGRKIDLPNMANEDFNRAYRHRQAEKQHYQSLEGQVASLQAQLRQSQQQSLSFAKFINNLKDTLLDDSNIERSDRNPGDNGGNRVLPPESGSSQDVANIGQPAAIISSASVTDERTNDSGSTARSNSSARLSGDASGSEQPARDEPAGGSSEGPSSGPALDVGESAD